MTETTTTININDNNNLPQKNNPSVKPINGIPKIAYIGLVTSVLFILLYALSTFLTKIKNPEGVGIYSIVSILIQLLTFTNLVIGSIVVSYSRKHPNIKTFMFGILIFIIGIIPVLGIVWVGLKLF